MSETATEDLEIVGRDPGSPGGHRAEAASA